MFFWQIKISQHAIWATLWQSMIINGNMQTFSKHCRSSDKSFKTRGQWQEARTMLKEEKKPDF